MGHLHKSTSFHPYNFWAISLSNFLITANFHSSHFSSTAPVNVLFEKHVGPFLLVGHGPEIWWNHLPGMKITPIIHYQSLRLRDY